MQWKVGNLLWCWKFLSGIYCQVSTNGICQKQNHACCPLLDYLTLSHQKSYQLWTIISSEGSWTVLRVLQCAHLQSFEYSCFYECVYEAQTCCSWILKVLPNSIHSSHLGSSNYCAFLQYCVCQKPRDAAYDSRLIIVVFVQVFALSLLIRQMTVFHNLSFRSWLCYTCLARVACAGVIGHVQYLYTCTSLCDSNIVLELLILSCFYHSSASFYLLSV